MTTPRAIVTGCSTGIGRSTALELTRRGYAVTATARRMSTIAGLEVANTCELDVVSDVSVAAAVAQIGPVDLLVNNAGVGIEGSVEEVSIDDARAAFDTNFFGAARLIQAFLPAMRKQGSGTIVNITSVAGIAAPPLAGFYAASKFALEALSESLAFEVGHFGIKVLVIEPGGVATAFATNRFDHRDPSGPYASLAQQWEGATTTLRGGLESPGPDVVASALCDALELENPPLRTPVGTDAEVVAASRAAMTYDAFEDGMRQMFGIDW